MGKPERTWRDADHPSYCGRLTYTWVSQALCKISMVSVFDAPCAVCDHIGRKRENWDEKYGWDIRPKEATTV